MSAATLPRWLHSSFYRFCPLADPQGVAAWLREQAQPLQGSIVVACEGISGAVAGMAPDVAAFEAALGRSGQFGRATLRFKHSGCQTRPFGRLKVVVKPEIVALTWPGVNLSPPPPDEYDASHLSPQAWRELLAQGDAVVLDNRNHFEWRLGRFKGAIDPGVGNFRDFVDYVRAQAPSWRAAGRPVAMYCTGGVRCDKTAPWMRSLGLTVFQLDGGILNHFQTLTDAGQDWEGECFVFDRRVALDARLQETGTQVQQVFDSALPDEAWRLARALRLNEA